MILTAYYPQTDGQIKWLNQTLKQYLQHYVNHTQNNWVSLLPIAQFIYNVTPQEGLKMSPFKANYGYALRTSLTLRQAKKTSELTQEKMDKLIRLYSDLLESSKLIQEKMSKYFNQKISKGPDFKEGNKMWLLYKNFKSRRLSKKLDYVKLGPFEILKKIIEIIFKSDLLGKMRIY